MLENGKISLEAASSSVIPVVDNTFLVDGLQSSSVSGDNSAAALTTFDELVVSSTPVQDFDADGYADILWRDAAVGAAALITLEGLNIKSEIALRPYIQDDQWQIQGVGQFNADDSPDLLWRHQGTGQTLVWLMDGEMPLDTVVLPAITDLDWEIRGVGNFEPSLPDSRADDLLWFNPTTGERVLWRMDGTTKRSSVLFVPDRSAPGDLLGVGDFDGDGTVDLLWQQETGELLFWKMDGTQFVSEGRILSAGNESKSIDAADRPNASSLPEPDTVAVSQLSPPASAAIATEFDAADPETLGLESMASSTQEDAPAGEPVLAGELALSGSSSVLLQSPEWVLGGIADYNQDGKDDILWQRRHEVEPSTTEADAPVDPSSASEPGISTLLIKTLPVPQAQELVAWEIRLWEIDVAADASKDAVFRTSSGQELYPSRETILFSSFVPESYEEPKAEPPAFNGAPIVPEDSPDLPVENLGPVLDPHSPEPRLEPPAEADGFNIEFDYRFDSQNWFTSERRAALEAAADVWERLLLDDFATTPAGTATPFVRHPEAEQSYVDALGQPSTIYTTDAPIDDVVILVGTQSLGATGSLSLAAASGFFNNESRYVGDRFQPWLGSLTVNRDVNWFFDPTPLTDDDIPAGQSDFISTAIHEIGHVLGFSRSIPAFSRYVSPSGDRFIGPQALARTDGLGIPLDTESSHIEDGFELSGSGETALDPVSFRGKRQLPTVLDAAIFDDLGYTVDYSQTAQNLSESA